MYAVVRAFAFDQCDPSQNPGVDSICCLSLLLVLSFAPRGFFSGYSSFPLSSKLDISKFQFNQESGRQRTTLWMCYLQNYFLFYLFISGRQKEKNCISFLSFHVWIEILHYITLGYLVSALKNLALTDFVSIINIRLNAFFSFPSFYYRRVPFLFKVIPTFLFYIQEDTLSFHRVNTSFMLNF